MVIVKDNILWINLDIKDILTTIMQSSLNYSHYWNNQVDIMLKLIQNKIYG